MWPPGGSAPQAHLLAVWVTGWAPLYFSKWFWHHSAAQARALCTWLGAQNPCHESYTVWSSIGDFISLWAECLVWVLISFSSSQKAQLDTSYICSVPFRICAQNFFLFCSWFSLNRKLTKGPICFFKTILGLCHPHWDVPLLLPWGWGCHCHTNPVLTGCSQYSQGGNAACVFVFLRPGEKCCETWWLITEQPGWLKDAERTWIKAERRSLATQTLYLTSSGLHHER